MLVTRQWNLLSRRNQVQVARQVSFLPSLLHSKPATITILNSFPPSLSSKPELAYLCNHGGGSNLAMNILDGEQVVLPRWPANLKGSTHTKQASQSKWTDKRIDIFKKEETKGGAIISLLHHHHHHHHLRLEAHGVLRARRLLEANL